MTQDSLMSVPSQIPMLMERLVQVMREKELVMPNYLNPGLTRQAILRLTESVIELPEDVIAFYKFMNGVRDSPDDYYANTINFGERILTLQEAIQERERFLNGLDEDEVTSEWVEETGEDVEGWLPILTYDYGYCFVDVNRHTRSEPCIFSTDRESPTELSYTNLESMLRTTIACYEQDTYLVKDGTVEDANTDLMEAIAQRYNPGIRVYDGAEVKAQDLKQREELRHAKPEIVISDLIRNDSADTDERAAVEVALNQIKRDDRDAAIAAIQEIKAEYPNGPIGRVHIQATGEREAFERAQNLYYQGDWPGAIAAFQQMLVRFPRSIGIDQELGYVKRRYREILRELDERRQTLSQDPRNMEARYHLGYLLRITGQTQQAREEWTKIVNEDAGRWSKSAKRMLDKYFDPDAP